MRIGSGRFYTRGNMGTTGTTGATGTVEGDGARLGPTFVAIVVVQIVVMLGLYWVGRYFG
jgi:hypothetical protein